MSLCVGADAAMVGTRRVLLSGNGAAALANSEVQVLGTQIGVGLADTGTGTNGSNNLLLSTQVYTSADWNTFQSNYGLVTVVPTGTVVDNAATLNSLPAAAFTEIANSGNHAVSQVIDKATSATAYTYSVPLKQGIRTRAAIVVFDGPGNEGPNGAFAGYDLAGGQIGYAAATYGTGFSAVSASIASNGDGSYTCTFKFTSNGANHLAIAVNADSGSGTAAASTAYVGNASGVAFYIGPSNLNTGSTLLAYGNVTNGGSAASVLPAGNPASLWGTQTANAWVGVDAGAAVQWTRYRFAPRHGSTSVAGQPYGLDYETYMQGDVVQTNASDSTFGSGNVTLDTIPTTPYYASNHLNERPLSGSARYVRLLPQTQAMGSIAGLQFFAKWPSASAPSFNAAPVAPVISPWGGAAPSGTVQVTISSRTKQASINYTTDGSTPACPSTGTAYTGPFTLSPGATTTVKAIACWAALSQAASAVVSAPFHNYDFAPSDDWFDSNGVLIEAHSGDIQGPFNGLYYWAGSIANKYDPPWPQLPTNGNIIRADVGVLMYSSPTLEPGSWTPVGNPVGNILPLPSGWNGVLHPNFRYNAANNNFVLWAHCLNKEAIGANDRACIATAANAGTALNPIPGTWSWVNTSLNPDGVGFKDPGFFTDSDGTTVYVSYVNGAQNSIIISKLSSDYQSSSGSTVTIGSSGSREAPVIVKNSSGTYFLLTSLSNFYQSGVSQMTVTYLTTTAANPLSGWNGFPGTGAFASNPAAGNAYNGQQSFVLVPQGKTQPFIGMDYWNTSFSGGSGFYASRQVWLPITFPTSTTLLIGVPLTWNLSTLNFLLNRDLDPASNDNSPAFLAHVG